MEKGCVRIIVGLGKRREIGDSESQRWQFGFLRGAELADEQGIRAATLRCTVAYVSGQGLQFRRTTTEKMFVVQVLYCRFEKPLFNSCRTRTRWDASLSPLV